MQESINNWIVTINLIIFMLWAKYRHHISARGMAVWIISCNRLTAFNYSSVIELYSWNIYLFKKIFAGECNFFYINSFFTRYFSTQSYQCLLINCQRNVLICCLNYAIDAVKVRFLSSAMYPSIIQEFSNIEGCMAFHIVIHDQCS